MLKAGVRLSNEILSLPIQGIDENGIEKTYTLSSFWGENILLYFCPTDAYPECAQEARLFNINRSKISQRAVLVCVSPDSIAKHREFQAEFGLEFILLSDTDYRIIKAFGAWGEKPLYGIKVLGVISSVFVIGKDGVIKYTWKEIDLEKNLPEILKVLELIE